MFDHHATPCRSLVLFGATGDLARRMLWPSLYALHHDGLLPESFALIGAAHSKYEPAKFAELVRKSVLGSANAAMFDEAKFESFVARVSYVSIDASTDGGMQPLRDALAPHPGGTIFYLSTSPHMFGPICRTLGGWGVHPDSRVVVEKPIGTDEASAKVVNEAIASAFTEPQVFRIDHYLGKEAVQNLLALRFANAIFEPLWNANAIEQVQITVAETVGVEGRWGYYDGVGALRDMVQNHLLQLLCLVAMEPPASFTPSAVRNEKVKVLWSLRPITAANVGTHTVTGQYAEGFAGGESVPGYREETGANKTSDTETFVALRAEIDNWRWAGVPFYLRTGKRMQRRSSEIVIHFKSAPYNIFSGIGATLQPNVLMIKLQPEEMITLSLMHKLPGRNDMQLGQVGLNLSLGDKFTGTRRRIAYERMLLDVLAGNPSLFVRRDEVEAAWKWIDGIVEGWRQTGQKPRGYGSGSWGPSAAIGLPERFGHTWNE
ncbi:glucose-6-phosphate dehydrogenase [Rhizobacter sp. Root1221]|uniref:glucose-6-phosphate dehydrogenase n=1 Tax=Rhizobacter sp. Root1221 TaxID=1736433 RepID=UPI0006F2098C|nr:glucose-6-phosphate dehydrogenase [Rhizobacter sp. Root1221]KQW00278.1 glucose-6-phosphate dehydrogenase [Rhizobacter sp. Root1221]